MVLLRTLIITVLPALFSPPSPTYAEISKSKTPSMLKPIASLLCEKVMTYSNRFLPSYETR